MQVLPERVQTEEVPSEAHAECEPQKQEIKETTNKI